MYDPAKAAREAMAQALKDTLEGLELCGTTTGDEYVDAIEAKLRAAHDEGLEVARRLCMQKMVLWTTEEDERSQDYREGVEEGASKIACAIEARKEAGG